MYGVAEKLTLEQYQETNCKNLLLLSCLYLNMSKVFVTNFAGHDYTKAEKFGELIYLTKGFVDFNSLDRIKFRVAEKLLDADDEDYLLFSGNSYISIIAAIIWYERFKRVKLLVHEFRSSENEYRESVITEKNINEILRVLTNAET